ncbi:hypothetical protein [Muricoccus aerilatus]|uniref:hypothetical protein n=1 Tax=Muricoccus aerilatus TaxID=452982 RepID=UPI0012EB2CFE|nr:hypothetical protein [Roseomonas aerilata]
METTKSDEVAEWRGRLADALRACLAAADCLASRDETLKLQERVRALEDEGCAKGFMPAGNSRQAPL